MLKLVLQVQTNQVLVCPWGYVEKRIFRRQSSYPGLQNATKISTDLVIDENTINVTTK